jgi:tRNA (guanine-N7-)-methyltransferase
MSLFIPDDYFSILHRTSLFPDAQRPLEVELGFGDGTFLTQLAAQHPERDFLGLERMLGRVRKTLRKVQAAHLSNVRLLRIESAYAVAWLLPAASVSRLHLLCPDPWPKKKHASHRLVSQTEFLHGLRRILIPGGEFLLKTDDTAYFLEAQASLSTATDFQPLDWPENAFYYPKTDFETHWLAQGREIHRARWRLQV